MAVYYKYKSQKNFRSVSIDGHYITVGDFKDKIFYAKPYRKRREDIIGLSNAQTNEEYLNEAEFIPKFTSVVVHLGSRFHRMAPPRKEEKEAENGTEIDSMTSLDDQVDINYFDFGKDVYDTLEVAPVISSITVNTLSKAGEDTKIQAYGRGGFERLEPPVGYVCHRCNISGHFIQHCPTNGDPNFDIKRFQPNGAVMVFKPNVPAIEKELEGIPSNLNVCVLPPEFNCPLCKQVMKDAAFTSKCCFQSFCDKCIRDQIISEKTCVCGATDRLADDLLPNYTLRDTITRMLETNCSNAVNLDQGKELVVRAVSNETQTPSQNVEATKIQSGGKEEESSILEQKVSVITKEPASKGSPLPIDKEVQHKQVTVETAKKKKSKKKAFSPMNGTPGPFPYNPRWNGIHPGIEAYMNPYCGVIPQYGSFGVPWMMPPQIPFQSRDSSKDQKSHSEVSNSVDVNSMKLEHILTSRHHEKRKRQCSSTRNDVKEDEDRIHRKQASVAIPIRTSTPRKAFSHTKFGENESSDDEDRHFKRRRSWYESSSPMNDNRNICLIPMES